MVHDTAVAGLLDIPSYKCQNWDFLWVFEGILFLILFWEVCSTPNPLLFICLLPLLAAWPWADSAFYVLKKMKHAEKANGFKAGGPQLYYAKTLVAFYSISLKAENVSTEMGLETEREMHGV